MNEIENPLTRRQKSALMELARSMGMIHVGGGIHMWKGERYYPTILGWSTVVKFNWMDEYRKLERDYANLQILHSMKGKENQEMRSVLKTNNPQLNKVWKILQGHSSDDEKIKTIRRFLMDKKKGG